MIANGSAQGRVGGLDAIEQDGVQTHAARARLPQLSLRAAQAGQFMPRFAGIRGLEQSRVLDSGIQKIGI